MYPVVKTGMPYTHQKPLLLSVYAPAANLLYFIFSLVNCDLALIFFLVAALAIQAAVCWLGLRKITSVKFDQQFATNFLVFSFLTYPFLFAFDRANIEIYIFASIFFFIYFQSRNKLLLSSFFLALGIALKIYPIIFIVLCIRRKHLLTSFVQIIAITIFSALMSIAGLLPFEENIPTAISWTLKNMNAITAHAANNTWAIQHSTSLYSFLKLTSMVMFPKIILNYSGYLFSTIILSTITCCIVLFSNIKYWQKTFLLIAVILLVPPVSFDYKLLSLYVPLFLFLKEQRNSPLDWLYLIGFTILFIPKAYFYIVTDISIAVPINCITLLLMSILIIANSAVPSLKSRLLAIKCLIKRKQAKNIPNNKL
jgi:hypothetical protein